MWGRCSGLKLSCCRSVRRRVSRSYSSWLGGDAGEEWPKRSVRLRSSRLAPGTRRLGPPGEGSCTSCCASTRGGGVGGDCARGHGRVAGSTGAAGVGGHPTKEASQRRAEARGGVGVGGGGVGVGGVGGGTGGSRPCCSMVRSGTPSRRAYRASQVSNTSMSSRAMTPPLPPPRSPPSPTPPAPPSPPPPRSLPPPACQKGCHCVCGVGSEARGVVARRRGAPRAVLATSSSQSAYGVGLGLG